MANVFISGSISIKVLPVKVKQSIDKIIAQNMTILVGDAEGIDALVQEYCLQKNYSNVVVYTVFSIPRVFKNNEHCQFQTNKIIIDSTEKLSNERERQMRKDSAMTQDSDYSLVVWDSVSRGSYQNILRAISQNKKVKLYRVDIENFMPWSEISAELITQVYRENVGYSAKEVVALLESVSDKFKNTKRFYDYLITEKIIDTQPKTKRDIYTPCPAYRHLLIVDEYHGMAKGVRFKPAFIDFIKQQLGNYALAEQPSLL
jgi:uncharacterized phage-like protein YoqJ